MRSCARRILLAATISMALMIFCVLLTLAILVRISLVPGMALASRPRPCRPRVRYCQLVSTERHGLVGPAVGELLADFLQGRLVRLQLGLGIDGIDVGLAAAERIALQ